MRLSAPFSSSAAAFWPDTTNAARQATLLKEAEASEARELHAVNVALIGNSLIFVAKVAAWFACGGSALLAEAIHSSADIGNQFLLRLGIMKAKRAPTPEYPYGYMKDKYVFSLISAVGIFCLGAGASIVNGVAAVMEPCVQSEHMGWGLAVLVGSMLIEGYSLMVAMRAVADGAAAAGMSFVEFVKAGRDPTSIAVMMEDGAAVAGLFIAAVATKLVSVTGVAAWDGIGSVLVGVLLAGVAVFLIQRNRSLLIGRSMGAEELSPVLALLNRDPVVKNVYDIKSEEIGPGVYRFKAEIDFDGGCLIERYMSRKDMATVREHFRVASTSADDHAFRNLLREYGTEVVSSVGAEVDRIEAEIQEVEPGIQYVDLETDRGRFSKINPLSTKEPEQFNS